MPKLSEGFVLIRTDDTGLRADARASIERAIAGLSASVQLGVDVSGVRQKVATATAQASAGQQVGVGLEVTTKDLRPRITAAVAAAGQGQSVGVGIEADAGGLHERVRTAVARATTGVDANVDLDLKTELLREKIRAAVGATHPQIPVEFDVESASAELARLEARIKALKILRTDIAVGVDTSRLDSELATVTAQAKAIARAAQLQIKATLDDAEFDAGLVDLSAKAHATARAARIEVGVSADSAEFDAELAQIETKVRTLRALRANIPVGVNADRIDREMASAVARARAVADLARVKLSAKLDDGELDRELAAIPEKAKAIESLSTVNVKTKVDRSALDSLGGSFASLGGKVGNFSSLIDLIKWPTIISGAGTAAGALGSLAAGAVALTSALGPLTGLLGAIPGLVSGAATGVGVIKLATSGIGDALKAVAKAQTDADESSVAGSKAAVDGLSRREDAIHAIGVAVESQRRSERELSTAQIDAKRAQADLTQARKDAAATLRDLRNQQEDNRLSEESDILSLARSRQKLTEVQTDPLSTELDRREAILGVTQAEQRLKETRDKRIDDAHRLDEVERKGIEGSDQVRAAQEKIIAVQVRLHDAMVASAEAAYVTARAQRDAARLQTEGTGAAATSAEEAAAKLNKLTPAARSFAEALLSMRPALDDLKSASAEALFPGVERGLRALVPVLPVLRQGLSEMGAAMGATAEAGGRLVASGPFRADLGAILHTNAGFMASLGRASLSVVDGLRHIAVAAQPLVEFLGRLAERLGASFAASAQAGRESGRLSAFFERTAAVVERLLSILGNLGRVIVNVGHAASGLGNDLLASFDASTQRLAELTGSIEGQNALRKFFDDARPALHETALLVRDIAKAFFELSSHADTAKILSQVRTELLPVLLRLAEAAQGQLLPNVLRFLTALLDITGTLAGTSGGLNSVVGVLARMAEVFATLIREVPGFKEIVSGLLVMSAIGRAFHIAGLVTGLGGLATNMARVVLAARGADSVGAFFAALVTKAPVVAAAQVATTGAGAGATAAPAAAAATGVGTGGIAAIATAGVADLIFKAHQLTTAFDSSHSSAERLGAGFHGLVPIVGEASAALDFAIDKLFGVKFATGRAIEAVGAAAAGIGGALGEAAGVVGRFFSETLPRLITESLPDAGAKLLGFFAALPRAIGRALGDVGTWLVDKGGDIIGGLLEGAASAIESLPFTLGRLIHDVLVSGAFAAGVLVRAGIVLVSGLVDGVVTGATGLWNFFVALPGRLVSLASGAGSWLVRSGVALISGLWRGLEEGAPQVFGFFVELPGEIVGAIGDAGSWLVRTGTSIVVGLVNGIGGAIPDVFRFFTDLPGEIEDAIGDAGSWLFEIGRNVIGGLADGVSSAVDDFLGGLGDIADDIVGAFADGLEIFSPSKAMARVGKEIPAGLAVGIDQGTPGLNAQMQRTLDSLLRSTGDLVSQFGRQAVVKPSDITGFLNQSLAGTQEWAENLRKLIGAGLDSGLIDRLVKAGPESAGLVKGLLEQVAAGGVGVVNEAQKQTQATLGNLVSDIERSKGAASTAAGGIMSGVADVLATQAVGAGGSAGGALVGGLAGGIVSAQPKLNAAASAVGANLGAANVGGIAFGMAASVGLVRKTIIEGIINPSNAAVASLYGSWKTAGFNAGIGLAQGMIDSGQLTRTQAEKIVRGVIHDTGNILQSSSPSRVFMRFGRSISEGLSIGISEGAVGVSRAVADLGAQVGQAAKSIGAGEDSIPRNIVASIEAGIPQAEAALRSITAKLAAVEVPTRSLNASALAQASALLANLSANVVPSGFSQARRGDIGPRFEGDLGRTKVSFSPQRRDDDAPTFEGRPPPPTAPNVSIGPFYGVEPKALPTVLPREVRRGFFLAGR